MHPSARASTVVQFDNTDRESTQSCTAMPLQIIAHRRIPWRTPVRPSLPTDCTTPSTISWKLYMDRVWKRCSFNLTLCSLKKLFLSYFLVRLIIGCCKSRLGALRCGGIGEDTASSAVLETPQALPLEGFCSQLFH